MKINFVKRTKKESIDYHILNVGTVVEFEGGTTAIVITNIEHKKEMVLLTKNKNDEREKYAVDYFELADVDGYKTSKIIKILGNLTGITVKEIT